MDLRFEKYRDSFLKEMNSKLEVLKEFVPQLKEKSGSQDSSAKKAGPALPLQKNDSSNTKVNVEEIYRAYHSIKGTAAFMGCSDISELIRPLEKYLYQIRALMTEGKDIQEAIAGVEFSSGQDGREKIVVGLRELANLLSQSIVDLERLVKKV